ncbi:3',5'-cyclic adenosine monophosphate phosphodiesterase CpdA [bioreactor metagenome]|uniref:3',5'-cyclic adenosine monophosphate phosphodiesterase CpdA n=1 Tax=bioreactor metagenome TaxID=1076179 RepID=A0A644WQU0_9ZZZZ
MVRIALISDIHFGKDARTMEFSVPGESCGGNTEGAASLTDGLVDVLQSMNVEYIFVAGDLTSVGSPQEFFYCEKKLIEIINRVNIPIDNLIVGVGNHDIDWKIAKLSEGYQNGASEETVQIVKNGYDRIAGNASLYNLNSIGAQRYLNERGDIPFTGVIEREDFILFILNSGWCCTPEKLGGMLTQQQVEWFREQASRYRDDQRWKIVMLHHHPRAYENPIKTKNKENISLLEEGAELINIAGEYHIDLILHGHRHHPRAETMCVGDWDYPVAFICAGSLSVSPIDRNGGDIPNTLHIIELADNPRAIYLYNYEYSSGSGWIRSTNFRQDNPMDYIMLLGCSFRIEERRRAIIELAATHGSNEIVWAELDDCLKSLSAEKLLKMMIETLADTHRVTGEFFRNPVYILDKKLL